MEEGVWFTGPEWLEHEEKWPEQPTLARLTGASEEEKQLKEVVASAGNTSLTSRISCWKANRAGLY